MTADRSEVVEGPAFTHAETGTPEAAWRDRPEWAVAPVMDALDDPSVTRLVVVAAHPDDETLAAGGLIRLAAQAGLEVRLVLLTDGEGSHPGSPTVPPLELGRRRLEESVAALRLLAPDGTVTRLGLPDGEVADHVDTVVTALVDVVGEHGPATVLVAPWRHDAHPDHEAAGRAAGVAATRTDATWWEFPVWLWHWGEPDATDWPALHVLPLSADVRAAKDEALALHRTQVSPLSDEPGDEVVLHAGMLEHFRRPFEVFVRPGPLVDDSLDRLHQAAADPWDVRTSWYEERKRGVTTAALPHARYARALEVGGSVGALAADLAGRCDELVVVDASAAAVAAAREALADVAGVTVLHGSVPDEWPEGRFDLVVVSEVGYFLSPEGLRGLVARVDASLTDDGVVVLCHWRHPVRGWPLDGPRVHELWRTLSDLPMATHHEEADFALDVLSRTSAHRAGHA